MREVQCRNCGAIAELPEYHGVLAVVCPQCEWQETHPPRKPIAKTMEGLASTAYEAHQKRMDAAEKVLDRVRALTPRGFEQFCAELLKQSGYEADPPDGEGEGLDLRRGREVASMVCRHLSAERQVEVDEIKLLAAALEHRGVERGFVLTTGTFAAECEKVARRSDIELLDADVIRTRIAYGDTERLEQWVTEQAPGDPEAVDRPRP